MLCFYLKKENYKNISIYYIVKASKITFKKSNTLHNETEGVYLNF